MQGAAPVIDPVVGLLVSLGGSLLFVSASWHKWQALAQFEAVLRSYQVLPVGAVLPLSRMVPLAELAIGLGLLAAPVRALSARSGAVLLLLYACAIGLNLARRRFDLDCGCAVRHERRPIARWMVTRNVLIATLLLVSSLPWDARPLGAVDALTVAGGASIVALLYGAVDRLLGHVVPRVALLRTGRR